MMAYNCEQEIKALERKLATEIGLRASYKEENKKLTERVGVLEEALSSEWVSVEDRLPEVGKEVLTCVELTLWNGEESVPTGEYSKPEKNFMFHKLDHPDQGKLIWAVGQPDFWTTLPSPPKGKE